MYAAMKQNEKETPSNVDDDILCGRSTIITRHISRKVKSLTLEL